MKLRTVAFCAYGASFLAAGAGLWFVDPSTGELRWVKRLSLNEQGGWLFLLAALPIAAPILVDLLASDDEERLLTQVAGAAIATVLTALGFAWFWPSHRYPWILVLAGGAALVALAVNRVKPGERHSARRRLARLRAVGAIVVAAATTVAVPVAAAAVIQAVNAAIG